MKTLRAILGTLVVVTTVWLIASFWDSQMDFLPAMAFIASLQLFAMTLVGDKDSDNSRFAGYILLGSVILFSANTLASGMGLYK